MVFGRAGCTSWVRPDAKKLGQAESKFGNGSVEVLHERAGAVKAFGHCRQFPLQGEETPVQLALELRGLLPIDGGVGRVALPVQERAQRPGGYRIAARQLSERLIEVTRERQQGIALTGETLAHRLDPPPHTVLRSSSALSWRALATAS
jgi:hypothetical protein